MLTHPTIVDAAWDVLDSWDRYRSEEVFSAASLEDLHYFFDELRKSLKAHDNFA